MHSQGNIKMAYCCNKFNAYCSLIWRGKNRLKKIRVHIFDDVGVAAAELFKKEKEKEKGFEPARVACAEGKH